MRLFPTILAVLIFSLSLGACDTRMENAKYDNLDSTLQANGIGTTDSADTPPRLLMRTAAMRFRVKDLQQGTLTMEKLVAAHGGYLMGSTLDRRVEEQTLERISADSNEERTSYTLEADLKFKVPADELDSVLHEVTNMAEVLDHREILAEDASLPMLSSALTKKRLAESAARIEHLYEKGQAKLKDAVSANQVENEQRENSDAAMINKFSLQNRVEYSDVHLQIYQRKAVQVEHLAINIPTRPYEPPFGRKLSASFSDGLKFLPELLLMLARIWLPLLLLSGLIYFLIKRATTSHNQNPQPNP